MIEIADNGSFSGRGVSHPTPPIRDTPGRESTCATLISSQDGGFYSITIINEDWVW
jgi:hypothetical protein